MNLLRRILSVAVPCIVIGAIGFFVYYSLVLYKPTAHQTCGQSVVAQQTDIAVHVVRQWAGKEGQTYTGCTESGQ